MQFRRQVVRSAGHLINQGEAVQAIYIKDGEPKPVAQPRLVCHAAVLQILQELSKELVLKIVSDGSFLKINIRLVPKTVYLRTVSSSNKAQPSVRSAALPAILIGLRRIPSIEFRPQRLSSKPWAVHLGISIGSNHNGLCHTQLEISNDFSWLSRSPPKSFRRTVLYGIPCKSFL